MRLDKGPGKETTARNRAGTEPATGAGVRLAGETLESRDPPGQVTVLGLV